MYHMNLPLEILRDTIIVNRPYNDPTEFQIVAVVDSSECGLEAAKDNAKFIVEACNNYPLIKEHKKWVEQMKDPKVKSTYDIYKKLTRIQNSPLEELGVADNDYPGIPHDKIMVDRAQYERMTNFVLGIFGALPIPPHTLVSVTDFVSDVQKLCSDYARGE